MLINLQYLMKNFLYKPILVRGGGVNNSARQKFMAVKLFDFSQHNTATYYSTTHKVSLKSVYK